MTRINTGREPYQKGQTEAPKAPDQQDGRTSLQKRAIWQSQRK